MRGQDPLRPVLYIHVPARVHFTAACNTGKEEVPGIDPGHGYEDEQCILYSTCIWHKTTEETAGWLLVALKHKYYYLSYNKMKHTHILRK